MNIMLCDLLNLSQWAILPLQYKHLKVDCLGQSIHNTIYPKVYIFVHEYIASCVINGRVELSLQTFPKQLWIFFQQSLIRNSLACQDVK